MYNRPYRPSTSYNVAVGASSTASANGVGTGIAAVRLIATTDCYVAFGASPTAAIGGMMLRAGVPAEYFSIHAGEKVAVIEATAAGILNITELTA